MMRLLGMSLNSRYRPAGKYTGPSAQRMPVAIRSTAMVPAKPGNPVCPKAPFVFLSDSTCGSGYRPPGSGPNGKGSLPWSGTPVSPNGRSVVAAVAFKAVAPAAIAPKKARLSIVSSSMLLKSCLLISSGTTASVPKLQRCCHEVQQLARKAMRSGVAPAFADTNPLSGDPGDVVLSERAKRLIRWHHTPALSGAAEQRCAGPRL